MFCYLYFLLCLFEKYENLINKEKTIYFKFNKKYEDFYKSLHKKTNILYKKINKIIDINYISKNKFVKNNFIKKVVKKRKIEKLRNYEKKYILFTKIIYIYYTKNILIPLNKSLVNKVKYPNIFSKDLLGINNRIKNKKITKIIKKCYIHNNNDGIKKFNTAPYILHYHIYDLSTLSIFINQYFLKKTIDFNIIITFCKKNIEILNHIVKSNHKSKHYIILFLRELYIRNKLILLHIPNRGLDIGGKILVVEFLKKAETNYKYILFMHSKSDKRLLEYYKHSLIDNLNEFYKIMDKNNNYAFFPYSIYYGYKDITNKNLDTEKLSIVPDYKYNYIMLKEFLFFFFNIEINQCKKHILFDGNFYILPKVFSENLFNYTFYSQLNTKRSFDYNWFNSYYNVNYTIYDSYILFLKQSLHGNFLSSSNNINMRDYMIEHVFERLIVYLLNLYNIRIHIGVPLYINNNTITCLKTNVEYYLNNV